MSDSTTPRPDVPDAVLAHFSKTLGGDDFAVISTSEGRLPNGGTARLFHAAAAGKPNEVASVTLDDRGSLASLPKVVAAVGRDPFVPVFGPIDHLVDLPTPREPVTIDPKTNDWRLSQCERETETITVAVPPSGTAAKADVYLLADNTGSMSSVIAAVQAGASAILGAPPLRRSIGVGCG